MTFSVQERIVKCIPRYAEKERELMDGVEQSPPVINKAEYVYQTLRNQILNGTYAPGTML